jgi:hypothetical protein
MSCTDSPPEQGADASRPPPGAMADAPMLQADTADGAGALDVGSSDEAIATDADPGTSDGSSSGDVAIADPDADPGTSDGSSSGDVAIADPDADPGTSDGSSWGDVAITDPDAAVADRAIADPDAAVSDADPSDANADARVDAINDDGADGCGLPGPFVCRPAWGEMPPGGYICDAATQFCMKGPNGHGCTGFDTQYDSQPFPPQCLPCPTCECIFRYTTWESNTHPCSCEDLGSGAIALSCGGCYGSPPARLERFLRSVS